MTEPSPGLEQEAEEKDRESPSLQPEIEQRPSGRLPYLTISPKWQFILIGGIFIAINIMVMIAFVVALALRY